MAYDENGVYKPDIATKLNNFGGLNPNSLADTTVQNRVKEIVSKDSPLMRQATTAGLQLANKRGLLNSSVAANATQDAAYRVALPIASQEADIDANKLAQDKELLAREEMALLDSTATRDRLNLELSNRLALQDKDLAYNVGRDDKNLSIAKMSNNTQQQSIMATYLTNAEQIYNNRLTDIMNNTNLTAAQRTEYVNAAKTGFQGHIDSIGRILDVSIDDFMLWEDLPGQERRAAEAAAAASRAAAAAAASAPAYTAPAQAEYRPELPNWATGNTR